MGNKKGNTVKHVVIHCAHDGVHGAKEHQHRNTSTSRTDWSFQATLCRNEADGSFTLTVEVGGHNHDAAEDTAAYPAARTLDEEQKVTALHLAKAGVSPKATHSILRQSVPMCKTILRDIYNLKVKAKYAPLAGRPPLEAFLDKLIEKQISHKTRRDTSGRITLLFAVPNSALAVAKEFSAKDVLLLDSTYKTNKFRMPLLHILGIIATNQSFSLAYCFTAGEQEEDYRWVMTQLRDVAEPLN